MHCCRTCKGSQQGCTGPMNKFVCKLHGYIVYIFLFFYFLFQCSNGLLTVLQSSMAKVHWPPMNKFVCKLHGYIVYFYFVFVVFLLKLPKLVFSHPSFESCMRYTSSFMSSSRVSISLSAVPELTRHPLENSSLFECT